VRIRTEFPRRARRIDHAWIPMDDGVRLAARIWLPEDAADEPVPALLEAIPYRKNDGTAIGDSIRHPYFAGHGYGSVRVDLRGSGDSEGVLLDEYLEREHDDIIAVHTWLAEQPWCTGATGQFGLSWGGFNSLQVAARRPPSLKAIIPVGATHDRYASDVHYLGGCLLAEESLSWASTMLAFNAHPPDPEVVGDRWREMWMERLEGSPAFMEAWLAHQRRDEFWQHGSVCDDYDAIECAVLAIGGWKDPYHEYVLRLLEGLSCPRKGLIGPWAHVFPEIGSPEPIGFLQEAVRWWDHWLKEVDNGVMDEPMLRTWMAEPGPRGPSERGRWIAEETWPSPGVTRQAWALDAETLVRDPGDTPSGERSILSNEATGLDSGRWITGTRVEDYPPDQRSEDGRSLCFTSAPLEERFEILGYPEVVLEVSTNRPCALVAVRLCDVAPDGVSTLVARGFLNLTHRESHEHPESLEPGRRYTVSLECDAAACAFPAGNRLRLAVSPAYWPWVWPSPEQVTLTVHTEGESRLELPVRPRRPEDDAPSPFGPAEGAAPVAAEITPGRAESTLRRDLFTGLHDLTSIRGYHGGVRFPDTGIEITSAGADRYLIEENDPLTAALVCEREMGIARGEWRTRWETRSKLTASADTFFLTNSLEAFEGTAQVFTRTWAVAIARDLV